MGCMAKTSILMGIVFPIVMAIVMSLIMSFAMVAINVGFSGPAPFFPAWGMSFLIGLAVALPVSLIFTPLLIKLIMKFADDAPERKE